MKQISLLVFACLIFKSNLNAQCVPPSVVTSNGASRCNSGTVNLSATPSAGSINWYAAATGGAVLSTGNTFATPVITTTTTYYAAAAQGGTGVTNASLATLTGGINGCTGGVMFNITPTVNIVVDSFYNLSNTTQTTNVTLYYKLGTYVGSELNAAAWTTSNTHALTTTSGQMATVRAGTGGISMLAGNTYGVFIANMSNGYTDGNATNTIHTNADLTLTAGAGLCGVFTSTVNTPRVFNGTVFYHKGSACESARVPVVATINPAPAVNLGNDTTVCPGVSHTFNAGNTGASFFWSNGATTQSITTSAAGTYHVRVTGSNGCIGRDTITVSPGIVPQNNLPATLTQCAGDPVTLNAGNTGSTFLWTPGGSTAQSITVNSAGIYSVQMKSSTGCVVTSSTEITDRPYPVVNLGNDTSICIGDQILLDAENPGATFSWSTGDSTQSIWASDSGTYEVVVTSPFGCVTQEERKISYLPSPYVEGFNFIPLFNEGLGTVKFLPLNPQNTTSYEWNFGDGSALSTMVNPTHSYNATGNYTVTLRVINGCGSYTTSLPIYVDLIANSISTVDLSSEIQVYPNPSTSIININNLDANNTLERIEVHSMTGRKIKSQNANNKQTIQLATESWSNGLYSISIYTQKGVYVKKVQVVK